LTLSCVRPFTIPVHHDDSTKELGPFQLALVLLSVVLLLGLVTDLLFPMPREISRLIHFVDTAICLMLFTDFSWRFARASSKLAFMRWGWLDLLACIPAVEALRWGRLFRIVRVIKLALALRSFRALLTQFLQKRRQAGMASALVLTIAVITFASIGMLIVEHDPASNIKTAEDALWWAMVSITTIGYGDRFPVTDAGRIIATVLMICGIGLFGTLSGVAASFFLGTGEAPKASTPPEDTNGAGATLAALETRVAALERRADTPRP